MGEDYSIVPVDYDPFGSQVKPRQLSVKGAGPESGFDVVPVDYDPFKETGIGEAAVKGVVSGAKQIGEFIGTGVEYLGKRLGSETIADVGKTTKEYWKPEDAPADLQGSIVEKPELLANPSWWVYNIVQTGTSMLPGMVAGGSAAGVVMKGLQGAAKAGKAMQILGKSFPVTEKLVERLATLGAATAGGVVGGAQEGSSTYNEVIQRGGTEEQAARAAEAMTAASGFLNAISFGKMLSPGKWASLKRFLQTGATEAFTEYLEEPAEIGIKKAVLPEEKFSNQEAIQQLVEGLNVAPAAFVTGGAMGAAGSIQRKAQIRKYASAVKYVANQGFEGVPDQVIENVATNAEELAKERPKDEKLQAAAKKLKKEAAKRKTKEVTNVMQETDVPDFAPPTEEQTAEEPQAPAYIPGADRGYNVLSPEALNDFTNATITGRDSEGNPFSLQDAEETLKAYSEYGNPDPESVKQLSAIVEKRRRQEAKPETGKKRLDAFREALANSAMDDQEALNARQQLVNEHPELAEEVNRAYVENQAAKMGLNIEKKPLKNEKYEKEGGKDATQTGVQSESAVVEHQGNAPGVQGEGINREHETPIDETRPEDSGSGGVSKAEGGEVKPTIEPVTPIAVEKPPEQPNVPPSQTEIVEPGANKTVISRAEIKKMSDEGKSAGEIAKALNIPIEDAMNGMISDFFKGDKKTKGKTKEPWRLTKEAFKEAAVEFETDYPGTIGAMKDKDGQIYTAHEHHFLEPLGYGQEGTVPGLFIYYDESQVPKKQHEIGGTSDSEGIFVSLQDLSKERSFHKAVIKTALSEGKIVPDEVLKDYPELELSALIKSAQESPKQFEKEADKLTDILGGEKYPRKFRAAIKDINFLLDEHPGLADQVPEDLRQYLDEGMTTKRWAAKEPAEKEKIPANISVTYPGTMTQKEASATKIPVTDTERAIQAVRDAQARDSQNDVYGVTRGGERHQLVGATKHDKPRKPLKYGYSVSKVTGENGTVTRAEAVPLENYEYIDVQPKAKEARTETPIYKEGDRVVVNGKPGAISKVDELEIRAVFGGKVSTTYTYRVKFDSGEDTSVLTSEIEKEPETKWTKAKIVPTRQGVVAPEKETGPSFKTGDRVTWIDRNGKPRYGIIRDAEGKNATIDRTEGNIHTGLVDTVSKELLTIGEEKAKAAPAYGTSNKIFTEDKAAKARAILKAKLSGTQLNVGLDPEILQAGIDLAGYHIEAGARQFTAYAQKMIADIGEKIRPYLKSFYLAVRNYPGFDKKGMDTEADLDNIDENTIDIAEIGSKLESEGGEKNVPENEAGSAGRENEPLLAGSPGVSPDAQTQGNVEPVPAGETGPVAGPGSGQSGDTGISPNGEREPGGRSAGAGAGRSGEPGTDRGAAGQTSGKTGRTGKGGNAKGAQERDLNHHIENEDVIVPPGKVSRAKANIKAIELLKKLESENRNPSPEEKKILAQFTGWGGLGEVVFNDEFSEFVDRHRKYYKPEEYFNDKTLAAYKTWEETYGKKLYEPLGGIMSREEWDNAKRSTLNAFYTSREVIESGLWPIVERLGFKKGIMLEPSAGVGHILGLIPENLSKNVRLMGVELDSTTGRILQKLYPEAKIQVTGFQDAKAIPDNSVDVVMSNFPFGDYPVVDNRHPDYSGWSIHNYFFGRSIDAVKPGGLVVAITSHFSLDAVSGTKVREYIGSRADLVGAIRLPKTAFAKNAGTEVVTDIVILRKKSNQPFAGAQPFKNVVEIPVGKGKAIINEYFKEHPEMVLGEHSLEGSMYGADEYTVKPSGDMVEGLERAVQALPREVMIDKAPEVQATEVMAAEGAKDNTLIEKDGKIYFVDPKDGGTLTVPDWLKKNEAQARDYVSLKHEYAQQIHFELDPNSSDTVIEANRELLNDKYDKYVKKYGPLNGPKSKFLEEDDEFYGVIALEDVSKIAIERPYLSGKSKGQMRAVYEKQYKKAEIFSKRTIFPFIEPKEAATVEDAVNVSITYRHGIDEAFIAGLLKISPEQAARQIVDNGLGFRNPKSGLIEPKAIYLSGYVKDKLKEAKAAAEENPDFEINVKALEDVQPPYLEIDKIYYRLGSSWIPPIIIEHFLRDTMGVTAEVVYSKVGGETKWEMNVKSGHYDAKNQTTWGVSDERGHSFASGTELVKDCLNLKRTQIYEKDEDDVPRLNKDKSVAAQQKQHDIQEAFKQYVMKDEQLATHVANIYNEVCNISVERKYEEPNVKYYPGAAHTIELRSHQKRGVARALEDSVFFAHGVGTGKTFLYLTIAMEKKRIGAAHKSIIVVQGSTLSSYRQAAKQLYPTAKILIPNEKQRDAKNRNRLMSRIATNDWDIIVVPHEFYDMLPVDPDYEATFVRDQLEEIIQLIREEQKKSGKGSRRVKDLEKIKEKKQARLKDLAASRQDNAIYFDQLGIDCLLIDEAHRYKRSEFYTKMQNVKGIDQGSSKRSFNTLMKARFVQDRTAGKNVYMATGTPISNTTAELWTMVRYVRPDILEKYNITDFDSFATLFGETRVELEQTPTGDFKIEERFNKYVNGPELLQMWKTAADVMLSEDLDIPGIPKIKGGAARDITVDRTEDVAEYVKYLKGWRLWWEDLSGLEKKQNSHVPLLIFLRAKQAAIDMRLVNSSLPDNPGSKLNRAADEIYERWKQYADDRAAQAVFCDMVESSDGKFNLYNELKRKLIEKGIPEKEIAVRRDYKESQRERLWQQVNSGDIRVIIGGTEQLGTGVNMQERLIALHNIDAPMRPMDMEQRRGRIQRQGNMFSEIEILNYGTKNTLDATIYQRLLQKQRFQNQVLRGDIADRSFEDPNDDVQMSFEDMMAAFSGNPILRERFGLENDIRKLKIAQESHKDQQAYSRKEITALKRTYIPKAKEAVDEAKKTAEEVAKLFPDGKITEVIIGYDKYTDDISKHLSDHVDGLRENATKHYQDMIDKGTFMYLRNHVSTIKVNGVHLGLYTYPDAVQLGWDHEKKESIYRLNDVTIEYKINLPATGELPGRAVHSGQGLVASIKSLVNAAQTEWITSREEHLKDQEKNLKSLEEILGKPFEGETKLKESEERLDQVMTELAHSKDSDITSDAEIIQFYLDNHGKYHIPTAKERAVLHDAMTPNSMRFYVQQHEVGVAEVKGEVIEITPGQDFFIYKDTKNKEWVVTERQTGLSLGRGGTKQKAIEKAKSNLENVGMAKFRETLDGYIKKGKVTPWYVATKLTDQSGAIYLNPDSEIFKTLFNLRDKAKEAIPHLITLGRQVYDSGANRLDTWRKGMKTALGDLWTSFKGIMESVWMQMKKTIANERGAINIASPKKVITAYKLFRTLKGRPGEIFPLFIGKNIPTPIGKWISAEFLPTQGFSHRPGWHVGRQPRADHLMKKDGTLPDGRVWAEVQIPADRDWQAEADKSKTKDIRDRVPEGGHYRFKRPSNQGGEWLISGAMKVVRILSKQDVEGILSRRPEVGGQSKLFDERGSFSWKPKEEPYEKQTKANEPEPPGPDATPAQVKDYIADTRDAVIQTAVSKLHPPHMSAWERWLASPEWYQHSTFSRIVRLFMRDREELYHEIYFHLTDIGEPTKLPDDTVQHFAERLKNKRLTKWQVVKGQVSQEYRDLEYAIDYGDTTYKRNKKKKLKEQVKEYEDFLRDEKKFSQDTIDAWRYFRESYDKALDLMTAQMRQMIEKIEEEAAFKGQKPADYSELYQTLKGALATMETWKGFYAPRLRQGEWAVVATKPGGGVHREHAQTELQARLLAKKLKREGYDIQSVKEIRRLPEDVYQDIKTVDVAKAIESALDKMSDAEKMSKFNEELLSNVADMIRMRGFRSSMIHRKPGENVVTGYMTDPIERHGAYINNVARGTAKAKVAQAAYELLYGKYIKGRKFGGIDPKREPQVYTAAKDYIDEQLRNMDSFDRLIAWGKAVATLKFLGFSGRSAIVNMTAMATTAPPAIHQYVTGGKGSMMQINRALAAAGRDYAKFMHNEASEKEGLYHRLTGGEKFEVGTTEEQKEDQKFLLEAKRLGWDNAQYTRDAMARMASLHGRVWNATMDGAMWLFGKTEQWNRGSTMLAAYRIAKQQGMDEKTAREAAKQASDKAHGIYGRATLPSIAWGRNPAAKLAQMMYVYSKFSHNYLQMLWDMGFRKHNLKGAAYTLLAPAVVGGMASFPFKDQTIYPLFNILFSLLGLKDKDEDFEKWVWDGVREMFGKVAERTGRYGLAGLANMDISGSLSIGVGVPKTWTEWGGAIGGAAEEVWSAGKWARVGDYWRAAEHLLPAGFANVSRAARERSRQVTTERGYAVYDEQGKPYKPTAADTALRVAGARSARQATLQERTWEAKRQAAGFKDRRDAIYERYRFYLASGRDDKGLLEGIKKDVKEYNQKVRALALPGVSTIKWDNMRRQARDMNRAPKRMREMLK